MDLQEFEQLFENDGFFANVEMPEEQEPSFREKMMLAMSEYYPTDEEIEQ